MKYTDARAVFTLAQNILKDVQEINNEVEEMESNLKNLEGSFLDDGIDEVKNLVENISGKTKDAASSAANVATQLVEYGDLLVKGK